jgi:hypothetical protein
MSRLFTGMAVFLGVGLMLAAGADAQTAGKPPQTSTVPPPVAKAVAPKTPTPAIALPPRTPDPDLDLPDTDTAKRVTGLGAEALGGADCRTQCHQAYYMCLANDDSGQCPASWARCLAACPANSSNF